MMPRLGLVMLAGLLAGPALGQEAADGAALFDQSCGACHNTGGTGTPGLAPPLDRPDFWQALGDDGPEFMALVMTKGMNMPITVRGEMYSGIPMPAVAGVEDEDLATIGSWVLTELGETEQELTAEAIAAVRDGDKGQDAVKELRPETE
ncbi:c-type cytochrome [Paracoccus sediminicola]|uniref:c-type cytochrome n=1 Tax=Paracoccus sediminicola TaxID=3017783 RepID=UPI0022F0B549|nr:cytochrome c [Paracoccus sediminicola]WBU57348.1 cytochrome c [Paracoccus sediminicola]